MDAFGFFLNKNETFYLVYYLHFFSYHPHKEKILTSLGGGRYEYCKY